MKCFECGGEVLKTSGTVRMTRSDGSLIIFKGIPMTQCRQCGEQYISGKWSEKMGELMRQKETLVFEEMLSVPVINFGRQTIGKEDSAIL
jgi:YgiT-type zinc finger domain-containing protein